jgi:hypothetical protein
VTLHPNYKRAFSVDLYAEYLQKHFFLYPLENRDGEEDANIATVTKSDVSTMAIRHLKPGKI